jgi:hypothetical protein
LDAPSVCAGWIVNALLPLGSRVCFWAKGVNATASLGSHGARNSSALGIE